MYSGKLLPIDINFISIGLRRVEKSRLKENTKEDFEVKYYNTITITSK